MDPGSLSSSVYTHVPTPDPYHPGPAPPRDRDTVTRLGSVGNVKYSASGRTPVSGLVTTLGTGYTATARSGWTSEV